jgi:hypothetical protein
VWNGSHKYRIFLPRDKELMFCHLAGGNELWLNFCVARCGSEMLHHEGCTREEEIEEIASAAGQQPPCA